MTIASPQGRFTYKVGAMTGYIPSFSSCIPNWYVRQIEAWQIIDLEREFQVDLGECRSGLSNVNVRLLWLRRDLFHTYLSEIPHYPQFAYFWYKGFAICVLRRGMCVLFLIFGQPIK
jgi:hypothetical protein